MSALPALAPFPAAIDAGGHGRVQPISPRIAESIWRGTELEHRATAVQATGWRELDAELTGDGWPQHSVAEIFSAQPAVLEWRLLSHAPHFIVQASMGH